MERKMDLRCRLHGDSESSRCLHVSAPRQVIRGPRRIVDGQRESGTIILCLLKYRTVVNHV